MDYAKNLSAAVAALFLAACADEIPCLATGAVKTENGCLCPEGTRLEEDLEAQTSACVADAGVDISPSGVEDSGSNKQDAGSMDAASEDGAVEPRDAEQDGADRDADPAAPEDEADSMTPPDDEPTCEATPEECDGQDDHCDGDGDTDEEVTTRCWVDGDGDGFAAMNAKTTESCDECGPKQTSQEPVAGKVDCDDADPMMSPGATDICGDGVDNDCDGEVDDEMNNACGGACTASLPGKPGDTCSNGLDGACARDGMYERAPDNTMRCTAPIVTGTAEVCDRSDNDCDGETNEGATNECGMPCGATCPPRCAPTTEVCDGKDNDCDDEVDEGVTTKWFSDCDDDGYAARQARTMAGCEEPTPLAACASWTSVEPTGRQIDCDDSKSAYRPGAPSGYAGEGQGDLDCDGVVEVELRIVSSNTANTAPPSSGICENADGGPRCECFVPSSATVREDGVTCSESADAPAVKAWYAIPAGSDPRASSNATGPCAIRTLWFPDGSGVQEVYDLHVMCR